MKSIFYFFLLAGSLLAQNSNPLQVVRKIADRVIKETNFNLITIEQKPVLGLQVIDFNKVFDKKKEKVGYAFSKLSSKENSELKFGISYSSPLKIWINDSLVFQDIHWKEFHFKEIAYSIFTFQDTFKVNLKKGINRIVIESSLKGSPVIYLREIVGAEENPTAKFLPVLNAPKLTWQWCFMSQENIRASKNDYPSKSFLKKLFAANENLKNSSMFLKPAELKKLAVDSQSTFPKESFADWTYPNGALMMTILKLWKATGDEKYHRYVEKYCSFIQENITLFRKQYFDDHDLRGSYYRIFRKGMLDDAGAPPLPFAEISLQDKTHDYDSLLFAMADYVMNKQSRLPDGTLCRPEPEVWTIWADDLFMSAPLLVRLGVLTNQEKYFNEAAKQIINFNKYLFDPNKKLYKHGWFSTTNKKSKIFWGRANGWIIWAELETLKYISANNPSYTKIKKILKEHLEGILQYQDESGLWHQILNDKSSFEETSCTAMCIAGLSFGIEDGLIDKKYSANVFNAWNGLQKNISGDGIVKDICCGTGIGMNAEFYKSRERFDNDPRGLGAVINAGIAVAGLEEYLDGK